MNPTGISVVCDSGPLIALAICGHLQLLTLFDAIQIPQAVLEETTADRSRAGAVEIMAFVEAHAKVHPSRDDAIYIAAAKYLDEGEAQALSLAFALGCNLLIDERRGRQAAQRHGIPVLGVLGLLLQAKRIGKIERIKPILDTLQTHGYRFSLALRDGALRLAGELS